MTDRKDRTRRLIQIGAVIERYFGIDSIEEAEALGQIAAVDPKKLENLKTLIKSRAAHMRERKQASEKET